MNVLGALLWLNIGVGLRE